MNRNYPLPNRIYPLPNRIYPVVPSETFFLAGGSSQFALLNERVYPFGDLVVDRDLTITLVEYLAPGAGSWTTVTPGSHADAIEALRRVPDTPTVFGTRTWQCRLTESGAEVRAKSVLITTDVRITQEIIKAQAHSRIRPFTTASFAYTATGITSVKYQVSGAATVAKTDIPRAQIVTGTHSGSNGSAVLEDSTADFINAGVSVGDTVRNTTDNSEATITAVTATTITGTLAGGTENDWDTGDAYIVYQADSLISRARDFEYQPTAIGTHVVTLFVHDGTNEYSDQVRLEIA